MTKAWIEDLNLADHKSVQIILTTQISGQEESSEIYPRMDSSILTPNDYDQIKEKLQQCIKNTKNYAIKQQYEYLIKKVQIIYQTRKKLVKQQNVNQTWSTIKKLQNLQQQFLNRQRDLEELQQWWIQNQDKKILQSCNDLKELPRYFTQTIDQLKFKAWKEDLISTSEKYIEQKITASKAIYQTISDLTRMSKIKKKDYSIHLDTQ